MSFKELRGHCARFHPGSELRASLMEIVKQEQFSSAFVISCIGSLSEVTIRCATGPHTGFEKVSDI